MLQTFTTVGGSTILTIKANIPPGQTHARDGTLRHALHVTGIGVLTELESLAPTPRRTDRQTTLAIPLATAAELATLQDMRDGIYGLPIRWSNAQQSAILAFILSVESKAFPGIGATLNARFRVTITIQPA